jgi:alpha-beta hydrolase superfamily lysophospholipase
MSQNFDYILPLDRPEIARMVFYPRPDPGFPDQNGEDLMIYVADGVRVGVRLYLAEKSRANILFFHGNGEIAADYEDIGPMYNRYEMNFFVADYRGYGKSNGEPSAVTLLRDAHTIYGKVKEWMENNDCTGPLFIMGRSLGSASALELASSYPGEIRGLILESAFAETLPLLQLLGIDPDRLGVTEENGFGNARKIEKYSKPTLIIHARNDHIIPFQQAEILMEKSPARGKQLVVVPGANHNNILSVAGEEYFRTIYYFVKRYARK